MHILSRFLVISTFIAFAGTCKATTVSIHEMYHDQLLQTVILAEDCHLTFDNSQTNDWLNFIKKTKANAVIECGESFSKDGMLLSALRANLENEDVNCFDPEFRTGYGLLATIMIVTMNKAKTYDEKKEFWHTPKIKALIHTGIINANRESSKILAEVKADLLAFRENSSNEETFKIVVNELDALGQLHNSILQKIRNVLSGVIIEEEQNVFIPFLFEDRYEHDNGRVTLKPGHLLDNIQDLHCKLFDLRIVMHILKNPHEKVILVCAGREHTQNVHAILNKLQFATKNSNIDDYLMIKKIWAERGEQDPEFLTSVASISYDTFKDDLKLSIPDFLASCTTLNN